MIKQIQKGRESFEKVRIIYWRVIAQSQRGQLTDKVAEKLEKRLEKLFQKQQTALLLEVKKELKKLKVYQGNEVLVKGEKKTGPVIFTWDLEDFIQFIDKQIKEI